MRVLEPFVRKALIVIAALFLLTVLIVGIFGSAWQKQPSRSEESAALQSDELIQPVASPSPALPAASPSVTPTPTPAPAGFPGKALMPAQVFSSPGGDARQGEPIPAGTAIRLEKTGDPLWAALLSDAGEVQGYLYAEAVAAEGSSESLFQAAFREKLAELREKLPQDKYWNHPDDPGIAWGQETPWHVTDIPCDHWEDGEIYCNFYYGAHKAFFGGMDECLGFASLVSDQLFGEAAPIHVFHDLSLLRVGDHIRLYEYEHSMIVTALTPDRIQVAECNENYQDCRISWNRTMSWEEFDNYSWDATYYSRYPFAQDGTGALIPWPKD